MKLPHDLPLSTRIAGSALILVALGALALMFVEEAHLRNVYFNARRADLAEALRINELRLTQAINTLRRDVQFLANTPPVSGIMRAAQNNGYDSRDGNTREQWQIRLQEIFAPFSLAHPEYYQLSYIGVADHGREIVHIAGRDGQVEIVPPDRLRSRADQNYFSATLGMPPGRVHLSDIGISREWDKIEQPGIPAIHASVPVFDANGKVFGLIVIGMDMKSLLKSAAAGLPADVSTFITGMHGQYLLHPDAQRGIEFAAGSGNEIHADFPTLVTVLDPQSPKFMPLQRIATQSSAQYLAAGRIHYDPDNPGQFLLLTYQLADGVARRFVTIPRVHIIAGFAALLLVCGIVLVVLRRTFSPLKQLAAVATEITAGTRDIRLPHGGGGEISTLTKALNAMLTELSRRERDIVQINEGLERQVAVRTQELTAVNDRLVKEIRERERVLRDVEVLFQRNQALMNTAMDGIHIIDMQGNLVEANDAFYRMLGYTGELETGLNVADWDAHFSKEELQATFKDLIGKNVLIETRHRRKDGTIFDVEIACSGIEIAGWGYLYAASRDISERKRAEAVLKRKKIVVDTAMDGYWMTDAQGALLEANEAYAQLSGYSVPELVTMHISQLEAKEQPENVREHLAKLIDEGYDRFETRHRHKDGHEIDIEVSARYLADLQQVFVFCRDITERKKAEEEIRALALHDQLTGLPNRRCFLERLAAALSASVRHDHYGAVLFIDMDNFKTLNDTWGHDSGDLMLIEVANRLRSCIREVDTAARFGGDEFVVQIGELGGDRDDALHRAGLVAENIRKALGQPYTINDHVHHSSPSIGVALYRGKEESMDALLQHADTAMYQAKDAGRNQVCFFEE
ncbi:MAG: diguanylate cyclase [Pseudomonadota bacterium]